MTNEQIATRLVKLAKNLAASDDIDLTSGYKRVYEEAAKRIYSILSKYGRDTTVKLKIKEKPSIL